jgi:hypothetical protein
MRSHILLLVSALAALPAAAQTPRVRRAFEPAVTPSVGMRTFGDRAKSVSGARAGYGGSFTVGASLEAPLSRRTGVMADLHLAPSAGQRLEDDDGISTYDNAMGISFSAALAARLRPQAPVFFFAGPGVLFMTKKSIADASGSTIEPMADFGFGYDGARVGRWNVRGIFHGFIVKPADPESAGFAASSSAFDWSVGIGARRSFGAGVAEGGR